MHPRRGDGQPDYSQCVTCRCSRVRVSEEKRQRWLRLCGLPEATENRTLASFQTHNIPILQECLEAAWQIVRGELHYLTLISDVDRGKTHLGIGICREWLARGKTAKYVYVPLLLHDLREGFQREGEDSYGYLYDFFQKVELLVLDDLGREKSTEWTVEHLEAILDYRYIHGLPVVVTTNRDFEELERKYNSRALTSRLRRAEKSKILVIDSPEYIQVKRDAKKKAAAPGKAPPKMPG